MREKNSIKNGGETADDRWIQKRNKHIPGDRSWKSLIRKYLWGITRTLIEALMSFFVTSPWKDKTYLGDNVFAFLRQKHVFAAWDFHPFICEHSSYLIISVISVIIWYQAKGKVIIYTAVIINSE